MRNKQRGFTLVELLVVLGILSVLLGLILPSLGSIDPKASLQTSVTSLITEIKQQQTKAMSGDSEGAAITKTGIYFETTRYTLFQGASYSPSDPRNFVVTLPNNIQITNILFPSSQFVFASGSGEIVNFSAGANAVTLMNTTNNQTKTIELNRYGVVTSVN